MDFKRHWKNIDGMKILSLGNGIIKASVFYTSLSPKNDPNRYQATVHDTSLGRFKTEELAIDAVEMDVTNRIIKILNQVEYGVK